MRLLQLCNLEFLHRQEGLGHPSGARRVIARYQLAQDGRDDLPGQAEAVLEPAALLCFGYGGELLPEGIDLRLAGLARLQGFVNSTPSPDLVINRSSRMS